MRNIRAGTEEQRQGQEEIKGDRDSGTRQELRDLDRKTKVDTDKQRMRGTRSGRTGKQGQGHIEREMDR